MLTDGCFFFRLTKSPLGFAGFATTLMTLSLSMMGARGVENEGMFIGNLLLLAGLGLIITAQWEMIRGNTLAYTILSAFGKRARCPRGSLSGDITDTKVRLLLWGLWYYAFTFSWDHRVLRRPYV